MPTLIVTYVAGGAALFFGRTAPLGLAMLAPAVVMITLIDFLLDTVYAVAAVNLVVFLALAWHLCAAYRPMWTLRSRVAHRSLAALDYPFPPPPLSD